MSAMLILSSRPSGIAETAEARRFAILARSTVSSAPSFRFRVTVVALSEAMMPVRVCPSVVSTMIFFEAGRNVGVRIEDVGNEKPLRAACGQVDQVGSDSTPMSPIL